MPKFLFTIIDLKSSILQDLYPENLDELFQEIPMYLLNPNVLNCIPDGSYFDMTDLIGSLKDKGLKIKVFPVSEKSWIDIGQLEEYKKAVQELEL